MHQAEGMGEKQSETKQNNANETKISSWETVVITGFVLNLQHYTTPLNRLIYQFTI
jgi:hypothetical protein